MPPATPPIATHVILAITSPPAAAAGYRVYRVHIPAGTTTPGPEDIAVPANLIYDGPATSLAIPASSRAAGSRIAVTVIAYDLAGRVGSGIVMEQPCSLIGNMDDIADGADHVRLTTPDQEALHNLDVNAPVLNQHVVAIASRVGYIIPSGGAT